MKARVHAAMQENSARSTTDFRMELKQVKRMKKRFVFHEPFPDVEYFLP